MDTVWVCRAQDPSSVVPGPSPREVRDELVRLIGESNVLRMDMRRRTGASAKSLLVPAFEISGTGWAILTRMTHSSNFELL
jgi:hypothetical protein